jgi:hypothetical protein
MNRPGDPGTVRTVVKEMAITREEFLRVVLRAFPGGRVNDGGRLTVDKGRQRLEITLQPLAPRSVGALRLPRQRAVLRLVDFEATEATALLADFDRAFQRGGG